MFDGNGNWTSDFSAQADRDNGIKILASRFDNIFIADIKESFENCLTKDGQIMPVGNFNMGGQRITNMADGVNANDAVNKNQLDSIISVPVGAILPYGGTSAPSGFLMCDGTAVSRTTYANLFAVIGISYGTGDGINTFNLPDFRDRTVFMRNDKAVGKTSLGSIPDHRHTTTGSAGDAGWSGSNFIRASGTINTGYASADTSLFGSSLYSQTVNKVIPSHASCNFIIRY